jgi:hypothetical protein
MVVDSLCGVEGLQSVPERMSPTLRVRRTEAAKQTIHLATQLVRTEAARQTNHALAA